MLNPPEHSAVVVSSSSTLQEADDAAAIPGNGAATRPSLISRCHLRFVLIVGVLLFAIGTAQAIVAGKVYSKGIRIRHYWFAEFFYLVAGDRIIGILACAVGVILFLVGWCTFMPLPKPNCYPGVLKVLSVTSAFLAILGIFITAIFRSFSERGSYIIIEGISSCAANVDGTPSAVWNGAVTCLCEGDGSWDVELGSEMNCEAIPGYADDLLASLVLIYILIVVMFLAMVGLCWQGCLDASGDVDRLPVVSAVDLSSPDQAGYPVEEGGQFCATHPQPLPHEPIARPVRPSQPGKC